MVQLVVDSQRFISRGLFTVVILVRSVQQSFALSSAQHRSIDVLDILVDCSGCIANLKNNDGNTPLHLAVMLVDDELEELDDEDAVRLDVVDVLLEKMMDDRMNLGYGLLCRNDY